MPVHVIVTHLFQKVYGTHSNIFFEKCSFFILVILGIFTTTNEYSKTKLFVLVDVDIEAINMSLRISDPPL